jgi:hypothetical protein
MTVRSAPDEDETLPSLCTDKGKGPAERRLEDPNDCELTPIERCAGGRSAVMNSSSAEPQRQAPSRWRDTAGPYRSRRAGQIVAASTTRWRSAPSRRLLLIVLHGLAPGVCGCPPSRARRAFWRAGQGVIVAGAEQSSTEAAEASSGWRRRCLRRACGFKAAPENLLCPPFARENVKMPGRCCKR